MPVEVAIKPEIRAFLWFLLGWTAVCAVVFLFASRFFHAWDGHAVSVLPSRSEDPAAYTVLIANRDGSSAQTEWPADVVSGLGLPIDAVAVPPTTIPDGRPETRKTRFQLHFLVNLPDADGAEAWRSVPTSSPRSFGLALLVLLVGIGVRNMTYSGTPVGLKPGKVLLPPTQAPSGAPSPPPRRNLSRKGPPPSRPRRGPRR